jgi:hypothetical protein
MSADSRAQAHPVLHLELAEPVPPQVPVGADVLLQVRVSGAARDLSGGRIEVVAAEEEIVATAVLAAFRDDFNETAAFAVRAPVRVEAFGWTVRFPPQEIGGIAYEGSALPVSSQTIPHRTSLAVWSVPSPVRVADCFAVTVGAKSSGACALRGARIEVHDEAGAPLGHGILGDTPWPGTDALYWTEIALAGPSRDGQQCWSVAFAAADLDLPHLGSSAELRFTAVKPPEHRVAVAVTEREAATPVEASEIALGPYRAATDKTGMAQIEVPGGIYDLAVWKSGFEPASRTVEIAADVSVQLELIRRPKELTVWD